MLIGYLFVLYIYTDIVALYVHINNVALMSGQNRGVLMQLATSFLFIIFNLISRFPFY